MFVLQVMCRSFLCVENGGNGEQTSEILHNVSVCKPIATDFAPNRWRRAKEWDGMRY